MPIRSASVILPCRRLDEFPTHLTGPAAAELLAAWTTLWHPALIEAIGRLPGWYSVDQLPEASTLEGEMLIVPSVSGSRLPGPWRAELPGTSEGNPLMVESLVSREATATAALAAAAIDRSAVPDDIVRDFFALGYAHLQVELLTRAMQYASVLDDQQFSAAAVEAAGAAVAGDTQRATDELARAFDLLMDARNHVYAVDYYLVDVTLLAASTLGEPLRQKLVAGFPTSLLATGELIDRIAAEHPDTLAALRHAIDAGTACIVGGSQSGKPASGRAPEAILADLLAGRDTIRRHLSYDVTVFGQFGAGFSPLLPEILTGCGFIGALHAAFDGSRFPRAQQRKTRWGPHDGPQIEALSVTPRDVARQETWLRLAEWAGDSIAHDHVATVLLAGWPGQACDGCNDLRRAARYGAVLGKPVTLDEYFRTTRAAEDWSTFNPLEYTADASGNAVAELPPQCVGAYRREVTDVFDQLGAGLSGLASTDGAAPEPPDEGATVALNPWSFACDKFVDFEPVAHEAERGRHGRWLAEVPGCGYQLLDGSPAPPPPVPLAEGRILRNERLEVVVSAATGGIQSLKTHRDRSTRASQRLVVHDARTAWQHGGDSAQDTAPPRLETQMIADGVEVTRNDALAGEITSRGRIVATDGALLARFTQAIRLPRGISAVIIDLEVDLERPLEGDVWDAYVASRLAWPDEAVSLRRGAEWVAREVGRSRVVSPEWIEIAGGSGAVTCFGLGLSLHRRAALNWLDTILAGAGSEPRRVQVAIGLDCEYPTRTALALLTSGVTPTSKWKMRPSTPRGWFLHVGARNVVITHIARLSGTRPGVRVRLLETEGRSVRTTLKSFRPFCAARSTDFLGQSTGVLSVVDGEVPVELGPYRWMQVEAEW